MRNSSQHRRPLHSNRSTTAVTVALLLAVAISVLAAASRAHAASPCVGGPTTPNARTTVSPDGATVFGSECADRIVVTSPAARKVVAGPGNDVIFANPKVVVVDGGEGDDVIYGELPEGVETEAQPTYVPAEELRFGAEPLASASLTPKNCEANVSCYGGIGSQELIGSSGNDRIFGQRGNDKLLGNSGNDQLFGGIGDEVAISGGGGNDLLSGGMGSDFLNGNQENDLIRGDGTTDRIEDASGIDTLSYATATTPGFTGPIGIANFPPDAPGEERGVRLYLDGTACATTEKATYQACNNDARYGGGYDEVVVSGIENVIGSPYADVIFGSGTDNRIDGGGGTDVLYGRGGNDTLYGGPDSDYLNGEEGTDTADGQGGADNCVVESPTGCAGSAEAVAQRDRSKISVGYMATNLPTTLNWVEVFLTGSTGTDRVKGTYTLVSGTGYVTFTTEGESATFDTSADAASANCAYEATKVVCTLPKPLDAITVAGGAGNDVLSLEGFEETTSPILLGGEGGDQLSTGNGTEDMVVDGNGAGADVLNAGPKDDALINNEGADTVNGGDGNDLLISVSLCDGDTLQGAAPGNGDGTAQNSASWAKLPAGSPGVIADLAAGKAGTSWASSVPACASGAAATLANIDDLEGSDGPDQLYGDEAANNLLGRPGKDELWARGGEDNIEAADGIAENGGGGAGADSCSLDGFDSFASCNP